MSKFIKFSYNIDSFCRNHCVLSVLYVVIFSLLLVGLQFFIYYNCHSYFLAVSGWSVALITTLVLLSIAISMANSYINWHEERKIGLKQTVDFKNMKK